MSTIIMTIAERVQALTEKGHRPAQVAKILTAQGEKISAIEVRFMRTYSPFMKRAKAAQAKSAARDAARRKRLKRKIKHRELLDIYKRWGCSISKSGRVILPEREMA